MIKICCKGYYIFKKLIEKGGVARAIPAPNTSSKPRSFFDGYNNWAKEEGAKGLGYILFEKNKTFKNFRYRLWTWLASIFFKQ